MREKVIVGMSGGIDSSVAALFLKKEGYEVIGITLKHLPDELSEGFGKTCCSLDDISDAKNVCDQLDIPHYVIDVAEEFNREIIQYFINTYNNGKTPSPCIICNEKIKIKKLLDVADKMGAKYIATGHYSSKSEKNLLLWDKKNSKDQTYMLYRLEPSILKRMLFPIATYNKKEIRDIAEREGIKIYSKPDSQGICFAPNGYEDFLKKSLGDRVKEGFFLDKDGKILGRHKGYQLYTIGQRRGLGLNLGKIYFIIDIRSNENTIILGDYKELQKITIKIINPKFNIPITDILGKKIVGRPRFSSKGLEGKLFLRDESIYFLFDKINSENAEGQHIVFYLENELIGGGEIEFI